VSLELLRLLEGNDVSGPIAPGVCSDPEPANDLAASPPTPLDVTQACLVALVYALAIRDIDVADLAQRLRTSPYVVARGRALSTLLAQASRVADVTSLPDLIFDFENALRTMRSQKGNPREPDVLREAGPEDASQVAANRELWMLHIIDGLFGAACRDVDIAHVLLEWSKRSRSLGASETIVAWLDKLRELSQADLLTRLAAMKSVDWWNRFAAAALILHIDDGNPVVLLRVHLNLLPLSKTRLLATTWVHTVCGSLERAWRRAATRRFSLVSPNVVVPRILEACAIQEESWAKIAALFLAAAHAVDAPVPKEAMTLADSLVSQR
jgi:hypothetical protein